MIITSIAAAKLLAALLGLSFVYAIVTGLLAPLRNIPGPFAARFTKLWYFGRVSKADFCHENIALHRKYGPLVRLAPGYVSIDDPSVIKTIYGISAKYPKSDWYKASGLPGKNNFTIFSDQDMRRHAESRKLFQNAYSMTSLVSYEAYVDECTDLFAQRLSESAASHRPLDMAHWFQAYAFDVIACITFGARIGFLNSGEDVFHMLSSGKHFVRYASLAGIFPWFHEWLFHASASMGLFGSRSRVKQIEWLQRRLAVRAGERTLSDAEAAVTKAEGKPKDFIDKLWDKHDEDPDKVSKYAIFIMGLSNITAGSDSTASTLSGLLHLLLHNPRVLAKLKGEIADATANGLLSEHPKFKEAQQLPYLDAVVKEALRLHSPVGLPLWREVPEGGLEIAGQFLPAGTNVGLNAWVAHRNKQVWGDDAYEFRPERWLEAQAEADAGRKERLQRMEGYYLPFGLGSRTCIGRHISILEIKKLLPRLLRDFEFEPERAKKDLECDGYWFVLPKNLFMQVKKTEKSA